MAFPAVVNESQSANDTAQTDQVVTLPGSLVVGNLLVAILSIDGLITVTWPAGWNELIDTNRTGVSMTVGWRIIDGSEGASITVVASAAEHSTHKVYQISGHDSGQAPEALAANGNSANVNPPSLTPTGGAKDYLWIAAAALQPGTNVATAFPASYGNTGQEAGSAVSGHSPIAWGRRELNAASEDPGTFTATSSNWIAMTVAIHPAAAAAGHAHPFSGLLGGPLLRGKLG